MASPFILAISTSSGVARVACATKCALNGAVPRIVFSFEIVDYKSQSALLLPTIQQHLVDAAMEPAQCAAIAVDVGPGGFTSLRTACGVAQGLAVAWNVPTVPLSSFECMLSPVDTPTEDAVTVLMDARLNEVYMATLSRTFEGTRWIHPPCLLSVDNLHTVPEGEVTADAFVAGLLGGNRRVHAGSVSAVQLALFAWQEFEAGRVSEPFDCQPQYVRDKVAQTTSERMAAKHGAV
jgi:tRNA threonylcarbamoyladenosine biosynthesis protein TsaB